MRSGSGALVAFTVVVCYSSYPCSSASSVSSVFAFVLCSRRGAERAEGGPEPNADQSDDGNGPEFLGMSHIEDRFTTSSFPFLSYPVDPANPVESGFLTG